MSLIVIAVSAYLATSLYSEKPDSGLVIILALIVLLGTSELARGLYYLIPFRYGSPWNGEMRWKATVFEYTVGFLILLSLNFIFSPFDSANSYVWFVLAAAGVICLFIIFGKIGAKRPHGPVKEDFFDRFLAKHRIF